MGLAVATSFFSFLIGALISTYVIVGTALLLGASAFLMDEKEAGRRSLIEDVYAGKERSHRDIEAIIVHKPKGNGSCFAWALGEPLLCLNLVYMSYDK